MSHDEGPRKRPTSGLLGDLETIRSLLQEEENERQATGQRSADEAPPPDSERDSGAADTAGPEDDDVPLLEDVVHGGVSINESFLSGEGDFVDSGEASGLNDEIFKALLSDEWRESARDLMDQARAAIEEHQTEWTPAHTDELNEALKVRIDETLQHWLRTVVLSRIDELRRELLDAVSEQIHDTIAEQSEANTREDPDGE